MIAGRYAGKTALDKLERREEPLASRTVFGVGLVRRHVPNIDSIQALLDDRDLSDTSHTGAVADLELHPGVTTKLDLLLADFAEIVVNQGLPLITRGGRRESLETKRRKITAHGTVKVASAMKLDRAGGWLTGKRYDFFLGLAGKLNLKTSRRREVKLPAGACDALRRSWSCALPLASTDIVSKRFYN